MLVPLLIAAITLLTTYSYGRLRHKRFQQYAEFPQLPNSLWLGHLKTVDEFIRRGKPDSHPDLALAAMSASLGRPPIMFIDLRPIDHPMVVVGSYEIAEQITKASKLFPYSPPKANNIFDHMVHLVGPSSILSKQGDDWKVLRKRFNAGFAYQHLMSFLPLVIEKGFTFLGLLDGFASAGQDFSLLHLTTNLTFDIIGGVVMDLELDAQNLESSDRNEFIRVFRDLIHSYTSEQMDLPSWLVPRTTWKRYRLAKRVKTMLKNTVINKYDKLQKEGDIPSRSILSLSLQDVNPLTSEVVDETCDQISTFLFAGHDTTSILLSWVFYELSRTPHALSAVRDELNKLFGPDPSPSAVRARLLSGHAEELLNRMTYTAAVIKETLRLWPPGGTGRMTKPGTGLRVQTPIGEYCLDSMLIYNCASIIMRDPSVYGDTADVFVPERWLQDAAKIPAGAWRPFERGPRNCIGQELANIEARVIIALVARRYDFIKLGTGEVALDSVGEPIMGKNGQYKVVSEMYSTRQVTSKPVDGMIVKVRVR